MQPQAAAGTYNFNLPITAGTTNQPLISKGGGIFERSAKSIPLTPEVKAHVDTIWQQLGL